MITQIQLQIVPGDSLGENEIAAFVALAEKEGVSPGEMLARLIREQVRHAEPKEAA